MKSTGGTDFRQIFGNLKSYYKKKKPHLMVILTDGYSYFPKKEDALGVPVIWCLTRNTRKPPFGQIIYLTEN
jgi:predicted metal-dependent peptidase